MGSGVRHSVDRTGSSCSQSSRQSKLVRTASSASSRSKASVQVKHRIAKSLALYACFLGMGLVTTSSTLGASLVTMEQLLGTDTKTISYAFTSSSLGFLTGAVICGATFDRINRELLFGLSALLQGVSAAVAPWTGQVYGFILLVFFMGMGLGFSDPGGNPYSLLLWGGHTIQNPFLQGIHFVWSVGSCAGPFIVRHFLVPLKGSDSLLINRNSSSQTEDMSVLVNESFSNVTISENDITYVRFAYAAVAVMVLLAGVFFIILWLLERCRFLDKLPAEYGGRNNDPSNEDAETKSFRIKFISLMCLSYFLYLGYEGTISKFISIFLVKYLSWNVKQGALATSAFWGAVAVGRLLNIPVSACLSPRTMLIINFTGTIIGLTLMLFVRFSVVLVWVSLGVVGLSISSTFASVVLWASQYIRVTGLASAAFLIGSSISSMAFPPFVGFMFQTYSPMWQVYISLGSAVAHALLMLGVYVYATYNQKQHARKEEMRAHERKPMRRQRSSSNSIVDPVRKAIKM